MGKINFLSCNLSPMEFLKGIVRDEGYYLLRVEEDSDNYAGSENKVHITSYSLLKSFTTYDGELNAYIDGVFIEHYFTNVTITGYIKLNLNKIVEIIN